MVKLVSGVEKTILMIFCGGRDPQRQKLKSAPRAPDGQIVALETWRFWGKPAEEMLDKDLFTPPGQQRILQKQLNINRMFFEWFNKLTGES